MVVFGETFPVHGVAPIAKKFALKTTRFVQTRTGLSSVLNLVLRFGLEPPTVGRDSSGARASSETVMLYHYDAQTESFDNKTVFRRTQAGQHELTAPSGQLDAMQMRFLAVVTGYTPLEVLSGLGIDAPDLQEAITTLLERGFIARARGETRTSKP